MKAKIQSLEQYLLLLLVAVNTLILFLLISCLWLLNADVLSILTALAILIPFQFFISDKIQHKIIVPYFNLLAIVDGLKVEDYSLQVKPFFSEGISATLVNELTDFSFSLRKKKQLFNEKDLLVNSLIQQLDSPVILIDEKNRIILGNQALSYWLVKDWRLLRQIPVSHIGLVHSQDSWQFTDPTFTNRFKVRSSCYSDASGNHQLLILTDIQKELRKMQQESWQQVVRVLSHEIKNSLTPIKSLAQSLSEVTKDPSKKQALNVIVERSQKLNLFVSQYAKIAKTQVINPAPFHLTDCVSHIQSLFVDAKIQSQLTVEQLFVDPVLFEQVLINLVENAIQAGNNQQLIQITSTMLDRHCIIKIIDQGQGIQNFENLFVPFYTTKKEGQGIGLVLSRNIIEQHGGELSIGNNAPQPGATAMIKLPIFDNQAQPHSPK